jgi:prepilin-type N-terminal cleavage/methylation domain-containing protein
VKNPGFSLVELLIASLIASILSGLLMSAIYQINRFVPVIDSTTAIYENIALINAQLERDLSGVTAPNEWYLRQKKPQQKNAASKQDQKKEDEEEQAEENAAAGAPAKQQRPLEKIFYSTNKGGMLDQLTFITTNPLQIYWGAKSGSAKPRVARVRYLLKEEKPTPKNPAKSYTLVRQESAKLDVSALDNKETAKEYEMVRGIKSLTVEYTAVLQEQKEQEAPTQGAGQQEAAKKESAKKEIKKVAEWLEKKDSEQENKQKLPVVPQLVEFTVALWDLPKKKSRSFSLKIPIRSEIEAERKEGSRLLGRLKELVNAADKNAKPGQQAGAPAGKQGANPAPQGARP